MTQKKIPGTCLCTYIVIYKCIHVEAEREREMEILFDN
jgi:hypothetical protein